MQPESQALVREFNRRLRAALNGAPNHVRLEAALEVESHVKDVLARHPGDAPEMERVAEILRGFGTPEEYARALVSQLPAVDATTVRAGAREVVLAAGDLFRGSFRLTGALLRRVAYLVGQGAIFAFRTASRGSRAGGRVLQTTKGPARQTGQWLADRGRGVLRTLGAAFRGLGGLMGGARRAGEAVSTGVGRGAQIGWHLLALLLRAAGVAVLVLLTLAAFGLAVAAAVAPDIIGFGVLVAQSAVGEALEAIRQETVYRVAGLTEQHHLSQTGYAVARGALAVGLVMAVLVGYIGWNSRRRRSSTVG